MPRGCDQNKDIADSQQPVLDRSQDEADIVSGGQGRWKDSQFCLDEKLISGDPQSRHLSENSPSKQAQRPTRKTLSEIRQLFQSVTAFDWDQKDILNLKQTPDSLFTPIVYWFWVNTQYFPFDAHLKAKLDLPVLQTEMFSELTTPQKAETAEALDPESIMTLYSEESFLRFKDFLGASKQADLADIESTLYERLASVESSNLQEQAEVLSKFRMAFEKAAPPSSTICSGTNMHTIGDDFLATVDANHI